MNKNGIVYIVGIPIASTIAIFGGIITLACWIFPDNSKAGETIVQASFYAAIGTAFAMIKQRWKNSQCPQLIHSASTSFYQRIIARISRRQ